jgi:hypothetical protein
MEVAAEGRPFPELNNSVAGTSSSYSSFWSSFRCLESQSRLLVSVVPPIG